MSRIEKIIYLVTMSLTEAKSIVDTPSPLFSKLWRRFQEELRGSAPDCVYDNVIDLLHHCHILLVNQAYSTEMSKRHTTFEYA
jgi:hypothetical protein